MAKKKKRAGVTKRAGTRKKVTKRAKSARKRATSPKGLQLKTLRQQLEKSVAGLQAAATREPGRYDATRMRLERWMADIDEICDPNNPDGCGPIMVFPV